MFRLVSAVLLAATATLAGAQVQAKPSWIAPPGAAAQVPNRPEAKKFLYFNSAQTATCPVGLSAEQRGSGQVLWTVALEDASDPQIVKLRSTGAGLHVYVDLRDKTGIRQVELSVEYLTGGPALRPASGAPPAASKTFELTASTADGKRLEGDLLVGRVAGITHLSVTRIDYNDGGVWRPGTRTQCRVEPALYMPVK